MNNTELEQELKKIVLQENYFNMIISLRTFEKEYKTSDFYKTTKKPLKEVAIEMRAHYALQFKDILQALQRCINELDISKLEEVINNFGDSLGKENEEIKDILQNYKDLVK